MARSIEAILADYERLNRANDKREKREAFELKIRLARQEWTPATKSTRLVGLQGR